MPASTRIIHKMIDRRYGIDSNSVLNDGPPPDGADMPVVEQINQTVQGMKALAFPEEDGHVNYEALRESGIYAAYRGAARRLPLLQPDQFDSHAVKQAFWINLYNALILDAVLTWDIRDSVSEHSGFFWKAGYNIGGCRFNAFDIEYGILRANAGHPTIPGPQLPDDARRAFTLAALDPRMHFALVCEARSCPNLRVYTPENIERQLDDAARRFINGKGVKVDIQANQVWLSKIFQWYAQDFRAAWLGVGDMAPALAFIAPHLDDPAERKFLEMQKPKVKFMTYDWSLNT